METPHQQHIDRAEFEHVYEPAEDSFLLIDALEADLEHLKAKAPRFCLEVGSGSGVVITAFGMAFPSCQCVCTDVNARACLVSRRTADYNRVRLECVRGDLATCFRDGLFDVVVFNPPYVASESVGAGLARSWAGGARGRAVVDRLLAALGRLLAPAGCCYLLLEHQNDPQEVVRIMATYGFRSETVIARRARNERLLVLKFYK